MKIRITRLIRWGGRRTMSGKDSSGWRQGEELLSDSVKEELFVAAGQVSAAHAATE